VCAWFVTWGDWAFFGRESFCSYYDAQALSMIDGRLDVPASAIGFEAFIFHGKTYGYFGIGPALLRVPLILMFGDLDGRWSRAMMMIACTANLICAYGILRLIRGEAEETTRIQRMIDSLFIICAGIGSTNVFMMSRSFVFHEAIMWSGTFGLLCAWTIMKYLRTPRTGLLALAGCFAFMCFHCRALVGTGALLALCLLAVVLGGQSFGKLWRPLSGFMFPLLARPLLHVAIAVTAICLTLGTYFGVNYAKFRTIEGVPLRYYNLYMQNPDRMQLTGAKQIHPENIPTNLATYFGLRGLRVAGTFPWFFLGNQPTIIGTPAIDVIEPFSSFPESMPAMTILALAGAMALWRGSSKNIRRARLPALTLLIGGAIVFTTVGITERYLHDLYAALIIFAAVGAARLSSGCYAQYKTAAIALLALIGVVFNCAFALVNQRTAPWGVPETKRAQFLHLQQSVDRFLHLPPKT
jgi:hypothetical protein